MEKAYLITSNTNLKKIFSSKKISRFYVGDAECDHNFLYFLRKDFYQEIIYKSKKNLTIVTPCIFTENNIYVFLKYIKAHRETLEENKVEFVVNDWGCFHLLKNMGIKSDIILGTHMYYQKRDPYSYKLSQDTKEGLDMDSLGNISIDFQHFDASFKHKNIGSFEIYNHTLLNKIIHLTQDVHIYYPHVIMSITKNCYNYSIYNNEKVLSTVKSCTGCYNKKGSFTFNNFGIIGKYSGNKYSYSNFKLDLIQKPDLNLKRIIYNYDL